MPKNIAIFDIDGTLFRSSLVVELNLAMVEYGLFPKIVKAEINKFYHAWINRHGSYDDYINRVVDVFEKRLVGVSEEDLTLVANLVMQEHKDRVYRFTRSLIERLRKTHTLIAISASPQTIVNAFAEYWKFNYCFGTEHLFNKNGIYKGKRGNMPSKDKRKTLEACLKDHHLTLKNSVGVGDTETDIAFLEAVAHPIAFNPNKTLYEVAKKRDWKIAVERKNVVYDL